MNLFSTILVIAAIAVLTACSTANRSKTGEDPNTAGNTGWITDEEEMCVSDIVANKNGQGISHTELKEILCQAEVLTEIELSCGINAAENVQSLCATVQTVESGIATVNEVASLASSAKKWYENTFVPALVAFLLFGSLLSR